LGTQVSEWPGDRITNEGVSKEGPELDTTWSNITNGHFRTDCIQLATKDRDDNLSKEGHIEEGGTRPIGGHEGSRQNLPTQHSTTSYNAGSDHTTDGVRHQGHVNRKKCRVSAWESIDGNQQVANDVGQKVLPWTSMDTPHPSIGTGSSTVGYTTRRGKGRCRDNDRVIMITHTETGKKDGKDHLYGQTMIARTSPQQGKSHKRRSTRNRCRQEKRNCRSYHKNKG
jgi:hypothetical protein